MAMISDKVYSLTHSEKTVTKALTASPGSSPGHLAKTLYEEHHKKPTASGGYLEMFMGVLQGRHANEIHQTLSEEPTQADLERAAECGNFGKRPSDLFLKASNLILESRRAYPDALHTKKMYCNVLATLETNPWAGMVSPPLLGSSGVVNLSIISV